MNYWLKQSWLIKKLLPLAILSVLVLGTAVCGLALHHASQLKPAASVSCSIETLLTGVLISSREYSSLLGALALLIIVFSRTRCLAAFFKEHARLPGWFFKLHNLTLPLRDHLLLSLSRGILQPQLH